MHSYYAENKEKLKKGDGIMGLFKKFVSQTRKPEGFLGKVMLSGMNSGHAVMAARGFSHLPPITPDTKLKLKMYQIWDGFYAVAKLNGGRRSSATLTGMKQRHGVKDTQR